MNLNKLFQILEIQSPDEAPLPSEQESLFKQALTHKSYLLENEEEKLEYDRLEFLGDSVLKIVINEYLFRSFQSYDSGKLTQLSAYLLSDKTLLKIASRLEITEFIRTSSKIKQEAVLSDVMEALFGACYLCFGFQTTQKLILRLYEQLIPEADASELKDNYKAALQEFAQSKQLGLPQYVVVKIEGPAHNPNFEVEIRLNGKVLGNGKGPSKKEAGQMAAKESLSLLIAQFETEKENNGFPSLTEEKFIES